MPTLPFDGWPPPTAVARLRFLRAAAYFEPPPPDVEADPLIEAVDRQSDRPMDHHALLAAADLGFAIDRTQEAIACIRAVVTDLVASGTDLRDVALPGAITGDLLVVPSERGFIIESRSASKFAPFYPSDALTPEGLDATLDLLLASLASGESFDAFRESHPAAEGPWLPPSEPLVQALELFVRAPQAADSRSVQTARSALTVSVASWSRDLLLHRRDRHHWDQARVRGPLVNLRLLAFEMATVRQRRDDLRASLRGDHPEGSLAANLQEFVRELVKELPRTR